MAALEEAVFLRRVASVKLKRARRTSKQKSKAFIDDVVVIEMFLF